jgi:hypothetical protein
VEWDAADLLDEAMGALALKRPIFHTEADFQHALAWEIHLRHPDAGIRLEKRVATRPNIDLDLFVELGGSRLGVELKYPRGRMSAKVGDELFILSTGADDYSRYFAVEDMARLERLVAQQTIDCGALVFLTNVANVWTPPASGRAVLYDEFRLHHGRTVTGTMSWGDWGALGGRPSRASRSITLHASYPILWRDYSIDDGEQFRYFIIVVDQVTQ